MEPLRREATDLGLAACEGQSSGECLDPWLRDFLESSGPSSRPRLQEAWGLQRPGREPETG